MAKIAITPVFAGVAAEAKVKVESYACISRSGQMYELKLKCMEGVVGFEGYKDISQLGRYRSLTMNGSVTRLYTNVYFAMTANLKIME